MPTALLVIRLLLVAVFALAAVTKLADRRGSREAAEGFGVPARLAAPIGTLVPFAELAVAILLLPHSSARFGAIGAFALLLVFASAIGRSMARGEAPDCHCFGQLHSAPAGWRTLARNAVLAALAAFVAIAGRSSAGPSVTGWIGGLHGAGLVTFVGGIVVALLAALTLWSLLALLRQNGRLLLRIDELEERLDAAGAPAPAIPRHGLPLGEPAPAFTLDGLYGERVTLEALTAADRPVMLLFTDPRCGPCNALMPQISEWQREHAGRLTLAVLTRGTAEDNRSKVRDRERLARLRPRGLQRLSEPRHSGRRARRPPRPDRQRGRRRRGRDHGAGRRGDGRAGAGARGRARRPSPRATRFPSTAAVTAGRCRRTATRAPRARWRTADAY